MTPANGLRRQDNSPTIDGVARGVEEMQRRLAGGERIGSRELRRLWSARLRPFWRLHVGLYRALSRRFLEAGDNYLASDVADEGAQFFGDDIALILTRALAAARGGAPHAAQELLARKQSVLANAPESKSLLARTFKDLWKASGEERYLREAFDLYNLDYTTTNADRTFPGVNAASMALFLGRAGEAEHIAGEVLELLRAPSTGAAPAGYWDQVTVAECLLVRRQFDPARAAYAEAAAGDVPCAQLATTRAQARLLLRQLGRDEAEFDPCFPLPGVIAFTGHRIDAPGRAAPRFPEALAPAVKERIRQAVARAKAGFGYSAASNGGDILFLEVMQEAGLDTYVHLPLPEEEFIRQSVEAPGTGNWLARYREVTAKATEFTCAPRADALAFEYGNRLLVGAACQHALQLGSEVRSLAVWDGRPGDGTGGTADFVEMVRGTGRAVEVIDIEGASGPHPMPPPGDARDQILSILSLSLSPEDDAGSRLAKLLREIEVVHREVSDRRVRIFFRTPAAAARAALGISRLLGGTLGLHAGPVRLGTHPLTGERTILGEHAAEADHFAALDPAGMIYTSHPFAALLGLDPLPGARCEFLGCRAVRPSGPREAIFSLVSQAPGTANLPIGIK